MLAQEKLEERATFRPDLVVVRRQMLGLTQTALAERAVLSQGTVSKLEQGLNPPTDENLEKLSSALECPSSFFFRPGRIYGAPMSAHPMFRKRASAGAKVLERLIGELNVRIMHLRTLLESVDIEPELTLPSFDIDDYDGDAAAAANAVRRSWLVPAGPIPNLTEYAERAGCVVVYCDMSDVPVDGVSYRIAGLPPFIFLNQSRPADRLRFSLAHELAHLILHKYASPTMEDEADTFASELLMPAAEIGPLLNNVTLEKLAYMKPYWRVSMNALLVRAVRLGRVDRARGQWLWRQMSARGYRTHEPAAVSIAPEHSSVFQAMFAHFIEELGYSENDLEAALHLPYDELQRLYQLKLRRGLKLLKK